MAEYFLKIKFSAKKSARRERKYWRKRRNGEDAAERGRQSQVSLNYSKTRFKNVNKTFKFKNLPFNNLTFSDRDFLLKNMRNRSRSHSFRKSKNSKFGNFLSQSERSFAQRTRSL